MSRSDRITEVARRQTAVDVASLATGCGRACAQNVCPSFAAPGSAVCVAHGDPEIALASDQTDLEVARAAALREVARMADMIAEGLERRVYENEVTAPGSVRRAS